MLCRVPPFVPDSFYPSFANCVNMTLFALSNILSKLATVIPENFRNTTKIIEHTNVRFAYYQMKDANRVS